ncbi:hypothetical protein H8E07_05185 [bacterium]|nr:hypothetical protein [bacterium]
MPDPLDAGGARKPACLHGIEPRAGRRREERGAMPAPVRGLFARCEVTP